MRVGYVRLATDTPGNSVRLDALKQAGCHPIFTDRVGPRPKGLLGLETALSYLRAGGRYLVVCHLGHLNHTL